MGKIKNLENYRDEFIDLYLKGYSLTSIAKIYEVTRKSVTYQILKTLDMNEFDIEDTKLEHIFFDYDAGIKVQDIAIKYNVPLNITLKILGLSANKNIDEKNIIKAYKEGLSIIKISLKYRLATKTIYNILKKNGIKLQDLRSKSSLYNINHDYFNELDEAKAYDLGVIFSCTYMRNGKTNMFNICKQKEYINSILHTIQHFTDKTKYYTNKNNKNYTIALSSKQIVDKFIEYGFNKDKLNIDKNLYKSFFDGYFEINLKVYKDYISISTKKNKYNHMIKNYLTKNIKITKNAICLYGTVIRIYNRDEIIKLLRIHNKLISKVILYQMETNSNRLKNILDDL